MLYGPVGIDALVFAAIGVTASITFMVAVVLAASVVVSNQAAVAAIGFVVFFFPQLLASLLPVDISPVLPSSILSWAIGPVVGAEMGIVTPIAWAVSVVALVGFATWRMDRLEFVVAGLTASSTLGARSTRSIGRLACPLVSIRSRALRRVSRSGGTTSSNPPRMRRAGDESATKRGTAVGEASSFRPHPTPFVAGRPPARRAILAAQRPRAESRRPHGLRVRAIGHSGTSRSSRRSAPGHPFRIAVDSDRVYVSTSAGDFFAGHQNSDDERVFTYDEAGALVGTTVIDTAQNSDMGLFGLALDGNAGSTHKLYVADMNGRILRLDLAKHPAAPEVFSQVPADTGLAGDWMKAMWNDLVFDKGGNLYVPDDKPRIWRVGPDGTASIWFTDPRLTGFFGIAGGPLGGRIDPTGQWLYVSITVAAVPAPHQWGCRPDPGSGQPRSTRCDRGARG